ncbi:hybrid sensor histidine kinase/response regulator transcription factor [Flammeovirga sp. SubArs3]|uniref:hybrid sensor histidine kinase/response regulator transcription factor n=1 Tax=Flammeovirga sp. SubArs3 TaxID=2995316 RepID=UPI00248AC8FF|nr:hybrid sensor histidine kinase/response regulator transcription factor [Flammeovirga sp. SubArs3]
MKGLLILLLTCALLLPQSPLFALDRFLEFSHIQLPENITNKKVNCFLEDDYGFMWIGLSDGLVRYDGYKAETILTENIIDLTKDNNGNIWIATFKTLIKFNVTTYTFERISLTNEDITFFKVQFLKSGDLYIGTRAGIFILDPKTNESTVIRKIPGLSEGLSDNIVRVLYEDSKGILWVGTQDQLNKYDQKKGAFTHYRLQKRSEQNKKNNLILDIKPFSKEDDSKLYVGTETGFAIFDTTTGDFSKIYKGKTDKTLSNNVIKSITRVNDNEIWLGTGFGLNIYDESKGTFEHLFSDYNNHYSITSNIINVIYNDQKGNIWLGTNNGVDKVSFHNEAFAINTFGYENDLLPKGLPVNTIAEDSIGNIWIGTNFSGLIKYDIKKEEYVYYKTPEILHSNVKELLVDKKGMLWVITPGGLNVINPKTNKIYKYVADKTNPLALQTDYLFKIAMDEEGDIWIGSMLGVYKVIEKGNQKLEFINFRHDPNNRNTIAGDYISDIIFRGADKNPWISNGNGIDYFHLTKGNVVHFKEKENKWLYLKNTFIGNDLKMWGFTPKDIVTFNDKSKHFEIVYTHPHTILSLFVDEKGDFWFTTKNKLNKYTPSTKELVSFGFANTGIRTYKAGDVVQLKNRIYFNSYDGFLSFDPNGLNNESTFNKVRFTSFKVDNHEIDTHQKLNERVLYTKDLNDVEKINLDYEENTFSIYFSSLDYQDISAHQYMFKLEGWEDKWQVIDGSRDFVSYIKVKPGNYTFKIKASDNFGKFGEEYASLQLTIESPIWATWYAKVFYFIVLGILFYFAKRITVSNVKVQNKLELEKIEREKSEEINQMKIKFFTNISHELRTPLTLISSPLEELESLEVDPQKSKLLNIIKRNTERLSRLVNQVLDLRKIDQGGEKLLIEEYDIVSLTRNITHDFMDATIKRNIDLNFRTQETERVIWFDLEKIEKVIYNLISNAIKFTPDNGKIEVKVDVVEAEHPVKQLPPMDYQRIRVMDSGIGIPKEIQSQIFNRFTNIKTENYLGQQGTGIGLSLVHDYVKMHGGWVSVESEEKHGAEFTLYIPLDKKHLEDYEEKEIDEVETSTEVENNTNQSEGDVDHEDFETEEAIEEQNKDGRPSILVVEDDEDMRQFLIHCLEEQFNVTSAANGKEGWLVAKKTMPDMILTDWMMPEMTGIELCNKVKANVLTNHIPVIILTAKGGIESKMEGIEKGADDYIAKPFNVEYLRLRVGKIITQREHLKKSIKREIDIQPEEVKLPSFEEKFLNEVMQEIEKNMDNSDFNVKMLGENIGMGQTNLYRKIKSMTGMTANEFIRNVRLKRAGQLLKQGDYNVSDVMYMVGFSHRSYFSKSFKEVFGVTPKEFTKKEAVD